MQGDAVRTMAIKKIEEKLMQKGINLAVLDNQELAAVALQFTGESPPDHLPRETIIEILSQQDNVQKWALSVKENIGSNVTAAVTEQIRDQVQTVQAKAKTRIENDPVAAQMSERFGVWLKESGFTSAQLTQMLDSNADGFVTSEEATDLIRQLSNTEPPEWVVDYVIKAMDSNGDGQLSIPEWWGFLESIGFETDVSIEDDEFSDLEQELLAEKAEEENSQMINESEQDMSKALAEAEKRAAERETVSEQETQEAEIELAPEEVDTPLEIETASHRNATQEIQPSHAYSTTLVIEQLEKCRLSSEVAAIMEQCIEATCVIQVDEVSRTLLGSEQYRRGCSIQGKINQGSFSVEIMFLASENDLVESFKKGSLITCQAKIVKWSSGSRRASLEGRNPVME